jgi:hypothetical protein
MEGSGLVLSARVFSAIFSHKATDFGLFSGAASIGARLSADRSSYRFEARSDNLRDAQWCNQPVPHGKRPTTAAIASFAEFQTQGIQSQWSTVNQGKCLVDIRW